MPTAVSLGLVLPEDYTPLTTFNSSMSDVDTRLAGVETWQTDFDTSRVAALEIKVADLETRLAALEATAATTADVEAVSARVSDNNNRLATAEKEVAGISQRLGRFSFATGDVDSLQSMSPLPDDQLYVVIDTAANLQNMADAAAENTLYSTIVFGHATGTA